MSWMMRMPLSKNVNVQQGVDGLSAIWSSEYRSGFSNEKGSLFRPMALTLFALEWELWPNNPGPPHVLNVLLYMLCCWLLFLLVENGYCPPIRSVASALHIPAFYASSNTYGSGSKH